MLPPQGNAEPGRFRMARTPYMRGIVDVVADPGVEEIVIVAGTQVGKTTAAENILGYWIDNDPGPLLVVKPTEADVGEYIKERIRPLLESSLPQHLSGERDDNTLRAIKLDTMPIYFGWAGSPGSLASRPCRYVFGDEVDKWPPFAGREADPISLARERTATYLHRRRLIWTSTPTIREGPIWQAWEHCSDRRYFFVPCPHCGAYQRLVWDAVKWPKIAIEDPVNRADEIERSGLAWYECRECRGRIEESHKPKMMERGEWRNEGPPPPSRKRVGFHLSSLYSPWRTFAAMAGEFIRAKDDPARTMNFRNSRLAEPFENVVSTTQSDAIRQKLATAAMPGQLPEWADAIFATADTQKDWFKVHIRAWGSGFRSVLLAEAVASSFDELYRITFESTWRHPKHGLCRPTVLLIDSGGTRTELGVSRTSEVYEFSSRDPGRIFATKGSSNPMRRPFTTTQLDSGVILTLIDTNYYKDMLHRLIHDPDPQRWQVHGGVSEQYISEMGNEHKVLDRTSSRMAWVKKTGGAKVEAWDCEVLQCCAAEMANLGAVNITPSAVRQPSAQPESDGRGRGNWLTGHRGRY